MQESAIRLPREMEFEEGTSHKFWSIELSGSSHAVIVGKVGTAGQTQTKEFDSDDEAGKSYDKLVAETLKKGDVETTASTASAVAKSTSTKPAKAAEAMTQKAAPKVESVATPVEAAKLKKPRLPHWANPAILPPIVVGDHPSIEEINFEIQSQRIVGVAIDAVGERAMISHPFTSRGQSGFENLFAALTDESLRPRYVCGHVHRRQTGVSIEPICIVFESPDGQRRGISPWTDTRPAKPVEHATVDPSQTERSAMLNEIAFELSELLLNGGRRARGPGAKRWANPAIQVSRIGLAQSGDRSARLSSLLAEQSEQTRWNPALAVAQTLDLLMLSRLADDIAES